MRVILLREIQERDLDALERFAQIPGFINLPNDRELLRERILRSIASFSDKIKEKHDAKYIFVAEDLDTRQVFGTSMIAAQHGTTESPHFYFQVGSEKKFSETIGTGFIHGTLELNHDVNGPSEIGGLVIDPSYRNSDARLGRQISFVRFLFLGLNPGRFKKKIIAELLPPLNKKGQSPLWEAVGRRFTNMDYWEADQLCQKNKEFIFSLFPEGKIYTTFLTAEARNAIGRVGKETEPVVHMLKKIGFEYPQQIDPFDGGPHLWVDVDKLLPVKNIVTLKLAGRKDRVTGTEEHAGIISPQQQAHGQFRAVSVNTVREGDQLHVVAEAKEFEKLMESLGLKTGDAVRFMPYY